MTFVRPNTADHQKVCLPVSILIYNIQVRFSCVQIIRVVKGGDDKSAGAGCSCSAKLFHVVRGSGQIKIVAGAGDHLKLRPSLRAQLLIPWADTVKKLGRRDVVILYYGAAIGLPQDAGPNIPTDRMVIDENIIRVLQE